MGTNRVSRPPVFFANSNDIVDRQTKIALRCRDEDELLSLQAQARGLNLCARSIQDASVQSLSRKALN